MESYLQKFYCSLAAFSGKIRFKRIPKTVAKAMLVSWNEPILR